MVSSRSHPAGERLVYSERASVINGSRSSRLRNPIPLVHDAVFALYIALKPKFCISGKPVVVHRTDPKQQCPSAPIASPADRSERLYKSLRHLAPLASPSKQTPLAKCMDDHLVTCFRAVPTTVLFTLVANRNEHNVSPRCAPRGERLHSISVLLEPMPSSALPSCLVIPFHPYSSTRLSSDPSRTRHISETTHHTTNHHPIIWGAAR